MPKIYDCFTYYNEELLLRLRLETLDKVVDTFVVAEATHTFSGIPKPLLFNPAHFRRFADRIIHIVVDDMPLDLHNAWANEAHQRNALLRGLTNAAPTDWVMISDIDEIPRPDAVLRYRPWNLCGTFVQRHYNYFINNLQVQPSACLKLRWWIRPKITTMEHLRGFFKTPENLRVYKRKSGIQGILNYVHKKVRHQRLEDGGWHFSWLMTPEQMVQKIESFSHTELNQPHIKSLNAIRSAIREGRDIMGKGERFRLVELDDSFPRYILDHFESFREWYLAPETGAPSAQPPSFQTETSAE